MAFSHTILANIQNGQLNRKLFIYQRRTKQYKYFLTFLWKNNLILGYIFKNTECKIFLKYIKNKPVIKNIQFISRSNKKVYLSINQIWKIKKTNKILLFSTKQGLKSLKECKQYNLGGELIAVIAA